MPRQQSSQPIHWLTVAGASLLVYVLAHWPALTNPYVINDDVRQQVFWMQRWIDPEIYRDDLLCRYAESYVPWGVQAVYYAASRLVNPVQFTKVVSGILFVLTSVLLYGLGVRLGNERAAFAVVCASFFFTTFMRKISGGIAQSFAFPLLLAYLFFLSRGRLLGCALTILVQSLFNPYIFLLSLVTHMIYLAQAHVWPLAAGFVARKAPPHGNRAVDGASRAPLVSSGAWKEAAPPGLGRLVVSCLPILAGILIMALKYVFLKSPEFGDLVTRAAMEGHVEYTSAGRYSFIPQTSFLYEVAWPWLQVFSPEGSAQVAAWIALVAAAVLVTVAFSRTDKELDLSAFIPFGYLLAASVMLYVVSSWVYLKLFIPARYLEFSLTIFYCMVLAAAVAIVFDSVRACRKAFPGLVLIFVILGAVRIYHIGIFDYSSEKSLYRFLHSLPKTTMLAGHPNVMDNCLTFSKRKAFITYELSHTWMSEYWRTVKQRTFDFFDAYYSESPEVVRQFAGKYGVDYLVVRERDFTPSFLQSDSIYFEPFASRVRQAVGSRSSFSVLDSGAFPIVYQQGGIRVLKLAP